MPELGKYAATVLWAYGITLGLLAGLVLVSALRARRSRDRLAALERLRNK